MLPSCSKETANVLITAHPPHPPQPYLGSIQILHHTQAEGERAQISHAIQTTERILEGLNEAIREREGAERLGEISKGLYVGQGYVLAGPRFLSS